MRELSCLSPSDISFHCLQFLFQFLPLFQFLVSQDPTRWATSRHSGWDEQQQVLGFWGTWAYGGCEHPTSRPRPCDLAARPVAIMTRPASMVWSAPSASVYVKR